MKKETITKALCILAIIILVTAGLSRILSSNSMTLAEYAAQKAEQTSEQAGSSDPGQE